MLRRLGARLPLGAVCRGHAATAAAIWGGASASSAAAAARLGGARARGPRPAAAAAAAEAAAATGGAEPSDVAIGRVMAAEANYVRVDVESLEPSPSGAGSDGAGGAGAPPPPRRRLLCTVRGLLKKMRQAVLVGDRVRVVGIDWREGRGMVADVLPRASALADPAIANVDHVLLLFALTQPPVRR